jgi:hypothetical protein
MNRCDSSLYLYFVATLIAMRVAETQVPLDSVPVWQSNVVPYGRCIALGDVDGDYDLDLAFVGDNVDNIIHIYRNIGPFFENNPSWSTNCNGAIDADWGDIDHDGDVDLAVAAKYYCYLYQNTGDSLEHVPCWTSSVGGNYFTWVGWGDVDNDGDLDLATTGLLMYPRVYYNNDGVLETSHSWQANDYSIDFAGAWGDVDDDGDLDLAVGTYSAGLRTRIYYNTGGLLENSASWITPYDHIGGLSWGDINDDSVIDLVGSYGAGAQYGLNILWWNIGDSLETMPSWQSSDSAKWRRNALGDVDADGDLDLAVAASFTDQVVYLNNDGIFNSSPDWYSSTNDDSWGIVWGDIDGDGFITCRDTLIGDGTKKLFYFSYTRIPIHSLDSIYIDDILLPQSDYCYDNLSGWISMKDAPLNGSMIIIHYTYSTALDLTISNTGSPCVLYHNTSVGTEEIDDYITMSGLAILPNPFSQNTTFEYMSSGTNYSIEIFDISGSKVKILKSDNKLTGKQRISWDGTDFSGNRLPDGIYFCTLVSNNLSVTTAKLILLE